MPLPLEDIIPSNSKQEVIPPVLSKLVPVFLSIACSVASVGVLAGGYVARLSRIEEDQKMTMQRQEQDRQNVQSQLEQIRDNMVDKNDLREVRGDIKELLRQRKP